MGIGLLVLTSFSRNSRSAGYNLGTKEALIEVFERKFFDDPFTCDYQETLKVFEVLRPVVSELG
jgi:hypothetical protein